eukprot:5354095-Pleurochrysis_carterae.AAC.1
MSALALGNHGRSRRIWRRGQRQRKRAERALAPAAADEQRVAALQRRRRHGRHALRAAEERHRRQRRRCAVGAEAPHAQAIGGRVRRRHARAARPIHAQHRAR